MSDETAVVLTGSSKSISGLRKDYEKLARLCDKAVADRNQLEVARLMQAKKEAHALWHAAVVADRHVRREQMRAAGRKPGNV